MTNTTQHVGTVAFPAVASVLQNTHFPANISKTGSKSMENRAASQLLCPVNLVWLAVTTII